MKIISGGQTGADRGALEAALDLGIPYGGWVPRGRRAEDGRVPDYFDLQEHSDPGYPKRTWRNVQTSDATAIICKQPPSGGSKLTIRYCRQNCKPFVMLDAERAVADPERARLQLLGWVLEVKPRLLNVAGSRESSVPGLQAAVRRIVIDMMASEGRSGHGLRCVQVPGMTDRPHDPETRFLEWQKSRGS